MRRALLLLAACLALAGPAAAQPGARPDWPERPVTILVPYVAGGPSDILACDPTLISGIPG